MMAQSISDSELKKYLAKVRKPELVTWLLEYCRLAEGYR